MKFIPLLALLVSLFPVRGSADPAKWEKEIAAFEQADREHPPEKGGIVFTGSSTIRRWKTLAADFGGERVVNRGFGGSQMEDSAYYVGRILVPHEPAAVVIFAGTRSESERLRAPVAAIVLCVLSLGAALSFASRVMSTAESTPFDRLELAAKLDPLDGEVRVTLAEAWASAGDCEKARVHADAARWLLPRHPTLAAVDTTCPQAVKH